MLGPSRSRPSPVLFTDEEWGELTDAVDRYAEHLENLHGSDPIRRRRALLAAFERLADARRQEQHAAKQNRSLLP